MLKSYRRSLVTIEFTTLYHMSDYVNFGMFLALIAVTHFFFSITSGNRNDIAICEVGEFLISKNQHTTDRKFKLTDPNTNTFLIGKTITN